MTSDPVTGYEYPEAWVGKCDDSEGLRMVADGLAVLTSSGKVLRRGFTTGTTASAACKSAILSLKHEVRVVEINLSCGLRVDVSSVGVRGVGTCRKFAGDYATDVTAEIEFVCVAAARGSGVNISYGAGVGRLTRPFNDMAEGDPAVSKNASLSIDQAAREAMAQDRTGRRGAGPDDQ